MDKKLNVKKEFDAQIREIWDDEQYKDHKDLKELIEREYWIEEEIREDSILFIGINPAYKEGSTNGNYYLNLQKGNEASHYNKKFEAVSDKVNHPWSHHDILFFRNTSQKFIKDVLWKSPVSCDFLDRQARISAKIIQSAKPKVIVVANTLAREYFKEFLPEYTFSEKLGTYCFDDTSSELDGVPIFFSGMLSGRRALDLGSLERLEWHIRQVLKK